MTINDSPAPKKKKRKKKKARPAELPAPSPSPSAPSAPAVPAPSSPSPLAAPALATAQAPTRRAKGPTPDSGRYYLRPPTLPEGQWVAVIHSGSTRPLEWTQGGGKMESPTPGKYVHRPRITARLYLAPGTNYIPATTWQQFIPVPDDLSDKANNASLVQYLLLGTVQFLRADSGDSLGLGYLSRLSQQDAVAIIRGTALQETLEGWQAHENTLSPPRPLVRQQLSLQLEKVLASGVTKSIKTGN